MLTMREAHTSFKFFQKAQGERLWATAGHSGPHCSPAEGQSWACAPQSCHPGQRGKGAGSGALTPGWGPNPGQHLRLVICTQDHEEGHGAVDVPPMSLGLWR